MTQKIVPQNGDYLMLVSLGKSFDQSKAEGTYKRENLYEAARRYWKVDKRRIPKITYILGVYKGIVRIVIKPTSWRSYEIADDGTKFNGTRRGCEGVIIEDSPYLNTSVSDFPFGSGNPTTFIPRDITKWFNSHVSVDNSDELQSNLWHRVTQASYFLRRRKRQ